MDGMERGRRGSHTERERERVGISAFLQFRPIFSLFQSNHTQLLLTKYRENGRLTFGMYAVSFFSLSLSLPSRPPPLSPSPRPKKTKTKNQYLDPNGWDLEKKIAHFFTQHIHTHTQTQTHNGCYTKTLFSISRPPPIFFPPFPNQRERKEKRKLKSEKPETWRAGKQASSNRGLDGRGRKVWRES